MANGGVSSDLLVGWREEVGLPDLGFATIKAKIDTRARTSALHAHVERTFETDGRLFVEFFTFKPNGKIGVT